MHNLNVAAAAAASHAVIGLATRQALAHHDTAEDAVIIAGLLALLFSTTRPAW